MTSYRKAIRFISLVLTLGLPVAASAATFDVKTLIDTDNRRSTGCNVVTPSGIVSGIDVIVTTQGTVTGATGTVTAVTRQTCVNPVLNLFGSATAVDGGWNVGVSPIGDVTVESHMGLDVLTWDNIGTPRFVFISSSGLSSDVLLTPWSWGGGDIIMPHAGRDRAMTPTPQRNILLDGASSDWAGNVPLANGTAAPPVWRFITARAYAGLHDLFFNFQIHTNPAAPTAHDDFYSLSTLGGTLTVGTLGVLSNDNPNNQPITASLVDTTQHGTLALAPDGGFTYVHDGSLASQDQFHYVAVGTTLSSNLATVTIDLPGTHPYTFTSPDNTTFTAGQANTFLVVVTGKPTPALTVDGALPTGVTFVDNGNGTGTLSGTPAANSVGTYSIVFQAEKNKPHQTSQNFTLTVSCPGVSAPITATPAQVCANSTGNSASGPAGMTTYTWSIANGTITSATNIQTITYTAGASGVVGLTLTVTDASGCAATNTKNVTINANPTPPAITPSPAQVCANSTGNTASGPAGASSYAWSIVNGTITSAANIQTITYTAGASGTVGLTLTVTNASGCSATNSGNVTVNPNPSAPAITPTPSTVCGNSTGNTASGPAGAASYAWSISNGTITSAANIQTIAYTAGASGTVGLTLTVTNASGCSASNNANVPINPSPATPTITPTPAQVCASSTGNSAAGPAGATTYAWSITNGTITSATNIQTITYTAGASGAVGLTLTVTNASGCAATNTANVTINANPTPPAITPSPAQVCANSTGNTASGPAGAASYAWSIVNGTITSATNIQTITYTAGASGTVGLTLTVTNASGCSATNSGNVTINANPVTPSITTPASTCANSTGNSAAGPAGATSYAWSITNGTITSATNIQTITYTAGASGTVGLTLTVTNASGCSATNTGNVTINPSPATPAITPTPAQVCANSTGNSAAGPAGATTYAWSIANGTITSATNIQTITYTAGASGVVGLTLTVTNASGCAATNTANVTINANPTTPAITPSPAQVCANSTGNTASGPAGAASYAWSIVNGTITSATNIQTITYTAGASGTVDLTLTVTNASGCSATNTGNVTINPNPVTPSITTPASTCANSTGNSASGPVGATSYAWSITNGTITSATNIQTITYTAGASGTVGLTLTVTNASGCSATNTSNVTINANPAAPAITPTPAQVCGNSTGNAASGPAGATSYAWSITNGAITSATNVQTITYTAGASGTVGLTLTVTNPSGCSATNSVNVTINPSPSTPTITPTPAQVCANSTGNTADGPAGATSYAWSIVNGTITSATNIQTITYTAGASGTVDLTLVVTNGSGCPASNTVNVTINANPTTPTISPSPASVCANSTGNTADGPAGATSYAWSIVNGTITSATNIQTITYTAGPSGTVDLTLVVTNAAGCSASNTANVTINPNPATPTITATPTSVCANSTGNTADGPAGATSYAWSIVNGTITSATNIQTITYTAGASGTVDLTLVVTNPAGCSASNTANVTINPSPATPTITPTPAQVCANSTGNSAAGPAGATSYAWSIVNGTITSATNIQTITYTAGASGTVDLTLVVSNASGCTATNTVNVTINANPTTPAISPSPAQVCANSTGNTASGPAGAASYAWSIVNGTITSATNIQTITYTAGASGTVDLTLVVTNPAGCSASNTSNVTINANPTSPTITPTPAQVCANSTGNSASGPAGATSYAWSIINGTITSATNIQTITYTAGPSGTVDLTLVVTNAAGCSASNTSNVTINANPTTPTISPSPAQVCANSTGNTAAGPAGATSYAWSIVNGTITSATNIQTITYTAGPSGTVDLTLVVTNPAGCSASNTVNVTINANPATPSITTPASVCANSTGNSASGPAGATSYAWSIVNGTITSATNIQTITYTAGASGTVDLTLVVSNPSGCTASNTVNVTINANPTTPTISPSPAQVCANSTGNTASGPAGATSYAWSIVNGTITSATNIQTITYTAGPSGTVDLTLVVSNGAGCTASNTANVTINANPATPSITTPASTCANSTGNSASGPAGATSYAWSIINGTITSATNIQTITYTAGASGTVGLTLVVTNPSGCSASNTANVTINANPATPSITTPANTCANSTGNSASGPAGATTYAWSIVNGSITSATNIQTITYTAGASGTVGLTLVVTNAAGCSASNSTNVTINANPAAPTITPTPATLCPSSTGNSAAGPAGATTYAWSITNGTITSATNIQTITYTAGASGNVGLTLVVTNAAGCSASNTVNVAISNTPPSVTTQPLTQSVQAGNSVTFTAAASGTPAPTVQWQVSTGGPFSDIGGETTTSLTFNAQLSQNGNQYRAVFTNTCGTATTNAATLTVTCPPITVTRNPNAAFPNGVFNTAYTGQSVIASGGGGSYTYAIASGALPTGLSLTAATGAITGTATATGNFTFTVTATDTATNCTGTSASLSIAIAPSANNDTYGGGFNIVDNTQFVVTGGTTTSPATPFVGNGTLNILTNDSSDAAKTATAGTFATSGGGSVTIAGDGTFIYTPKANPGAAAVTSDSFTYTVVSNGVTSAAATVNLTLASRVWYVKNNGGGTNGQSQSPFTTLAAAQAASLAGDIIFVYNGDGLTTGQSLGITLKNNQQLIGEGVALVVNSVTLKAAGTKPQITNTAVTSDVVTLADGDTVKGLTITAATRDGIAGLTHAGFTADTLTIQTSTSAGLHLTSMTGTVTVTNTTFSGANGTGVDVNNGTAAITLDNTNSITANAGMRSVSIQNRPAAAGLITIGAGITDNGTGILVNNNASGTIAFTGTQTLATTTNTGVNLTTNTGTTINFSGTLNVTTTTGSAFNATGNGTLNVTGTANVTTGAAGTGVNINGVTVGASGVTFTSINTTGATTGVSLTSLGNGNVAINGGTISGGTTGLSLNTLGTSTVTLAGVTFTGSTTAISGATFGTLSIGAAVNVSGATALNLATGAVSGTFANVSSTGDTNGVTLSAVTGTWGVTAGTLTGATGSTFNATGTSTGTVSWGGAITQANGANVVTISGSHTGTINFSGNVQTSGTSTGITISGSSGTYNFTGATNTIAGSGGGIAIGNGATESGTITFGAGTSITSTAAGAVFNISGPVATVSANVTYSGTISKSGTSGPVLNVSNYSGTLLMNGTSIVGLFNGNGSSTSTLSTITGSVTINNLSLTSGFNTFVGTQLAISGTNTGSTITFNHLVLSATGSGHTGAGLVDSGTGGTVTVTGTGGGSTIDTGGPALSLNGQAMGTSTIASLSCTAAAAANCVSLTTVSGTLTISAGSITGAGAAAFLVSGGAPTISYGGTITANTAGGRAVDLQTRTGGTITFSGLITSSGGNGIFMNNAAGGSTTVFSGGMTLSTGAVDAFTATGGGVVNVSGTNNITSTSGKGINWNTDTSSTGVTVNNVTSSTGAAVTIASSGASNFTFNDVTSTTGAAVTVTTVSGAFVFHAINANGAATGISVTGASGSFTVNGTTTTAGTGGTVQNCTAKGADIRTSSNITLKNMNFTNNATANLGVATTCGDALNGTNGPTNCNSNISLLTITTATLNNVTATGSKQIGIDVNGGTNLTLTNVTATGNGNEVEEDGVQIVNLLGTLAISGGTYKDNAANEFEVQNGVAGTLTITADSATFSNTTYPASATTPSNTTANGGLFLATHGANGSIINPTVTNCTFDRIYTQAFRADMAGNTGMTINFGPASGAGNFNTVSNAGGGAIITGTNTGTVTFSIRNNNFQNNPAVQPDTNSGGVISARKSAPANGTWTGTIQNNTVGTNGTAKSGCVIAGCIGINFDTSNASGNYTTTITGNSVFRTSGDGINVHGGGGSDSTVIRTTIQSNTLGDPEPNGQGAGGQTQGNAIFVEAGTVAGDTTTVKAQIDTNTASGQWSTAFNLSAIRVRQRFVTTTFCLTNYNPATSYGGNPAGSNLSVSSFLTSANPASTAPAGYTVATATQTGGTITGPSCP